MTTTACTGDLTIKGTTRRVTLDLEVGGVGQDPWGNTRLGVTASGSAQPQGLRSDVERSARDGRCAGRRQDQPRPGGRSGAPVGTRPGLSVQRSSWARNAVVRDRDGRTRSRIVPVHVGGRECCRTASRPPARHRAAALVRTRAPGSTVGRRSTSPRVSAKSAFRTGRGDDHVDRAGDVGGRAGERWRPRGRPREIQLIHCRPEPNRPPSPSLNSGSIFASAPPLGASTIPDRR